MLICFCLPILVLSQDHLTKHRPAASQNHNRSCFIVFVLYALSFSALLRRPVHIALACTLLFAGPFFAMIRYCNYFDFENVNFLGR